jgi:molybdopterin-containing oxidoreductase family iron-sulfur binding subunit
MPESQRQELEKKYRYRWGMVVDVDRCTGCKACEVACAAENNVPVAGVDEVAKGREYKWIRVERYWEGEYPNVRVRYLPVLCQQCEQAPCEPVCPVYATYHGRDHLNVQVYNRCVGTRYCANNCPYNARYFNWFKPQWPEPLEQQLNPDVTVRSAGVMEKCTFCIQRIRRVEEDAKLEGRAVADGEMQPACAQACPTDALIFGDLDDPESLVSRLSRNGRRQRLLEDLGTQPKITYLKKAEEVS